MESTFVDKLRPSLDVASRSRAQTFDQTSAASLLWATHILEMMSVAVLVPYALSYRSNPRPTSCRQTKTCAYLLWCVFSSSRAAQVCFPWTEQQILIHPSLINEYYFDLFILFCRPVYCTVCAMTAGQTFYCAKFPVKEFQQ